MKRLFVGNDNVVELNELKDVDGAFDNAATVTFTLRNFDDDADVQAQTSMPYVSSSDGKYRGTIADTTALVDGVKYRVQITATGAGSEVGFWNIVHVATDRAK
jgi:hypothetical protein